MSIGPNDSRRAWHLLCRCRKMGRNYPICLTAQFLLLASSRDVTKTLLSFPMVFLVNKISSPLLRDWM